MHLQCESDVSALAFIAFFKCHLKVRKEDFFQHSTMMHDGPSIFQAIEDIFYERPVRQILVLNFTLV